MLIRAILTLEAVVERCGRLAAWVCVGLVLVVAGNVFARYFFRTGTIWLQELEWHLISPIALLVMAWIDITFIALPLFLPFFIQNDVDLVWLGVLIALNLQTSFLTPPFGWALFFLEGVAPQGVATGDIYRGVVPFIDLQLLAVAVVFLVPGLATWLPGAIGW